MPAHSIYLARLSDADRAALEKRLYDRQSGKCFLCDAPIDLDVQSDALHVDHVIPIVAKGADDPINFALTHASCNERKGATNLEIAKLLFRFQKIQDKAKAGNGRGANLEDILGTVCTEPRSLRIKANDGVARFSLAEDPTVQSIPLYTDTKSGMKYFFAVLPIEYLHHDDRINPRTIGGSLRGLMEEFYAGRPQLHVSLAWWRADDDGAGPVKVFDGQHKAAAQILLGARHLPLRIFLNPDLKVLLQANTNAGDTLKQVAFDMAVMRHLGSALYRERLAEYRKARNLLETDLSFSEQDLVSHFRASRRETQKYILDSVRNAITHDSDNRLFEFVEMAGKSSEKPLSYSAIEKTLFSLFLYLKPLSTPLDHLEEEGKNPRHLEHVQMVRLMNLYADNILVGRWDPDQPTSKLEHKIQRGELVSHKHLAAHRLSREEVLHATLTYVALVIKNFYAYTGEHLDEDRMLQVSHPDALWNRIESFLINLRNLPCWVDAHLSGNVFGAKFSRDYWLHIFKHGTADNGTRVLAEPLDIKKMIAVSGGEAVGV